MTVLEERYVILKIKHLEELPVVLQNELAEVLDRALDKMPPIEALVIEKDWPEYDGALQQLITRAGEL